MIKNVVDPIPYRGHLRPIKEETIRAFGLGERDAEVALGQCKHKYNFIDQNKLVAARYRDQQILQQTFKRSVLNKATD